MVLLDILAISELNALMSASRIFICVADNRFDRKSTITRK